MQNLFVLNVHLHQRREIRPLRYGGTYLNVLTLGSRFSLPQELLRLHSGPLYVLSLFAHSYQQPGKRVFM